ncbi:MAG: hypothetical protein IJY71_02445 [Clostridia bacterium]|nr:hypothetical protein [Clostridia bacterium]
MFIENFVVFDEDKRWLAVRKPESTAKRALAHCSCAEIEYKKRARIEDFLLLLLFYFMLANSKPFSPLLRKQQSFRRTHCVHWASEKPDELRVDARKQRVNSFIHGHPTACDARGGGGLC